MNDEPYVIDASMGDGLAPFCYCPVELTPKGKIKSVIFGMNCIGFCPGKLIGVIHQDGQNAVELFCKANPNWKTAHTNQSPTTKLG